jgi:gliding motility-associated-like protein
MIVLFWSIQSQAQCTSFNGLTTPLNSNNGQRGIMFDVMATNTVTVKCFDANLYAGTTANYEIYYRAGTHVGHENNAASWTLLGNTTALTSLGNNVLTPIPITVNVTIPAGQTYSFYVTNDFGGGTSYTDGTTVGNFLAGDANITVYEGVGKSYPFGLSFNVRNFNGRINYDLGGSVYSALTTSTTGVTCSGNTDGQAEITVQNGTAPYTVNGTAYNSNPFTITGLAEGSHTFTVTDNGGNSTTTTATIAVNDVIQPNVITQNLTIPLDASGNASITAAQIDNGSSDACGIASMSLDNTSFTCANLGANTVTLTVTDINGNSNTETATVTVEDNISPTATTQNITAQLDASGSVTITAAQIDNSSSDNCSIASMSLDNSTFSCTDVGSSNTVTLTVTDPSGNSNTATATVTVEDNVAPNVITQDITVTLDGTGNATITAAQIDNGSSDACGIASMSLDITAFTTADLGPNTVTLTVTDVNGNSNTNTAIVTVVDNNPPTVVTQDITVQLDASGNASITAAQIDNGSTDNTGIASMSLDITSFTCADVGANTVTLTVTDTDGNSSTGTATVTVQDNISPNVITQNITIQLDASGNASITNGQIDNGSSDACGIASFSLDNTSFSCSDVGSNTVTLTVTDNNGNSNTGTATVTIEDNVAPTVVTQDITVSLDGTGNATITAAQIDNGSSDACGIASMSLDITAFTIANLGPNTVTLTVTDNNGNSNTSTAIVTVVDNNPPNVVTQNVTVQLDASGNASITAAQIDNGSTDNTGIASMSLDITSFTCANIGGNTVTLTVTDTDGNSNTGTATVTVQDNIAPTVSTQNIIIQLDANGNATINTGQIDNGSTDNCSVASMSLDNSTFTCSDLGANTVTLTVTDPSGNSNTGTATVNIQDNAAPTVTTQDITVPLDGTGNATITPAQVDNGSSDPCGIASMSLDITAFTTANLGPNTVTLTVIDNNGNSNTNTAIVTIVDNNPPNVITQNITVNLDATGNASITAAQIDNGSTDNTGIASMSLDITSFNCSNVGANNVTLTVTDTDGNSNTGMAIVTVQDNIAPTVATQNITAQLDASGNATITAAQIDNGSSDICGVGSLSLDNSAFNCTNVGANTVTLTVTDVNGNSNTGTATVNIQDNVAPSVITQDITVALDGTGNASITAAQVDNGSSDACGIASMSLDISAFTTANLGPNTVTLTVMDNNGNSNTNTAIVTIVDNTPPTVVTQDVTVALDASGNATITATQINNGSSDNGGIASMSLDVSSFTCSNIGANTVTLTVTDNHGNSNTGTATVTVQDNAAPTVTTQNITVQLDASGNATITATQVNNGSADNCSVASMSIDNSTFNCSNVGTNTVTLTVTDGSGNSNTGTATVTVEDNVAPTVVTQNISVQLDGTGNATITAAQIDNGSSDACGIASMSLDISAFTTANIGTNTVTLTVTDVNGNSNTGTATVTVQDNVPPIVVTQDITIQLDASGNASITATQIDNGSTDNIAIASMSLDITTFNCSNVGANTVTLTVTDNNGNSSTGTATVTVQDNIVPTVTTQNITIQLDASGNTSITTTQIDNGSTDACGIASMSLDNTSFNCSNVGANTVTLTVTDVNGNANTSTATVTVEDNIIPTVVTQDITVQLNGSGNATITAAQIDNGSSDACGIASMSLDITSFTTANIGPNTVTLTVTDINGNSNTETAIVTVGDNVPPTVVTQNMTVQLDASGNASITPAQIDNGSSDNAGIASMSLDNDAFTCAHIGANTVTLTVTDVNGNSNTGTAIITVVDNLAPNVATQNITVQLNASGNASITAAQIDNGSTDNCGVASITLDKSSFDCNSVGTNTVTLTVTDVNGNSNTSTATVTIQDNVAPNVVTQNITTQLDASGNVTITAVQIDNGSADACGIASMSLDKSTFSCSDIGSANTVTLTVTDIHGNSNTSTATVTIQDNVAPNVVTQNITTQLDASGNASITAVQVNNGSSDACGIASMSLDNSTFSCVNVGTNTVTLTVTDIHGNSNTSTATITIQDNVLPTVVTQNITAQLDANGNASIGALQINNGSSDNCGISAIALNDSTFNCSDVGTNTVTLTITDAHGNSNTGTATVTIQDNVLPTVITQNITTQLDASGNATITAAQIDNGSTDNCGLASMSLNNTSFTCANVGSANTVTLTVTDVNGNSNTSTATVTVQDMVLPTVVTQNITAQLDASGNATITAAQIDNGSTDNCSVASIALDITSFDCSNVGTNTVTLTVTDVNGNANTGTATVTIEDNIIPTVVTQNIIAQLDANGNATITAAQIDNGSTDNCTIANMTLDITAFDCSDIGANTVTLTVTDVNGNSNASTATVTVEDNVAPNVITQDITIQLNANGQAVITEGQINNGSTDACGIADVSLDITAFDCSDVGANTVTLTVIDVNGNAASQTATVNVEDNIIPTVITRNIEVSLDAIGQISISPSQIDNGSFDNCTIASMDLDIRDFDCDDLGENTVILTVTDVNGNSNTATATVTVYDLQAPTLVCQSYEWEIDETGELTLEPEDLIADVSDNCDVTTSISQSVFNDFHIGTNEVIVTATDEAGNTTTCTTTVEVTFTCIALEAIITPNNDGRNDTWEMSCAYSFNNRLHIFNRAGNLVYSQVNYTGGWNGISNNGAELSQGPYFYVLEVELGGGLRPFRGSINIIRGK